MTQETTGPRRQAHAFPRRRLAPLQHRSRRRRGQPRTAALMSPTQRADVCLQRITTAGERLLRIALDATSQAASVNKGGAAPPSSGNHRRRTGAAAFDGEHSCRIAAQRHRPARIAIVGVRELRRGIAEPSRQARVGAALRFAESRARVTACRIAAIPRQSRTARSGAMNPAGCSGRIPSERLRRKSCRSRRGTPRSARMMCARVDSLRAETEESSPTPCLIDLSVLDMRIGSVAWSAP